MRDILHSKWRISGAFSILSRCFNGQYAIYHRGSGDTHLLDSASFFVLNEIDSCTHAFAELLEKLTDEYEFASTVQSKEFLNSIILEFEKLLIIERLDT